jgi:riboflavin synthase
MFTGIIERLGRVVESGTGRLRIQLDSDPEDWKLGESVAVNGCCLTLVEFADSLAFDLSPETLARTTLGTLPKGQIVNLERAMPANGRFGGHFVQGHVDAKGRVAGVDQEGNSTVLRIQGPPEQGRLLVDKGSIAVDGVSLTVVKPSEGCFSAHIVPHTLAGTSLEERRMGDEVNLEYDLLAKHVANLLGKLS